MNIYYSSHFKKAIKKYRHKKSLIAKKLAIFEEDPFHKSLKTHKLSGKLSRCWSFSIDYHIRVLFEFIDKHTVDFVDIGTHEIYQ